MDNDQPEKLLSEKQLQFINFLIRKTLSVMEIDKTLKGTIPKVTIKQALSRLVTAKLVSG